MHSSAQVTNMGGGQGKRLVRGPFVSHINAAARTCTLETNIICYTIIIKNERK